MSDPLADYRSGSTEPWSVNVLCAMIRAKRPHVLVETGTYRALTTLKMFEAMLSYCGLHSSLLYTVEQDMDRAKEAWKVIAPLQSPEGTVCVTLTQGDALVFLNELPDASVDFVFLDDDHGQQHVNNEIAQVMRALRPGGICCVHDVIGPFALDAVVRAYGGTVLEFERLHAAGGLGVLAK